MTAPVARLRTLVAALAWLALATSAGPARAEQARIQLKPAGGNIAIQLDAQGIQANGRRIFVPEPKGSGESLDENANQGQRAEGDVVTTIRGDRIVGHVLTIEAGGKLHLTAPHFEGEVVVLASALDTIEFMPKEKATGSDEASLTNGDRVVGEIASIGPEAVIMESPATGPLKISRRIVEGVVFGRGTATSIESRFAQGKMEPWTARGGGWSLANGAVQCTSQGQCQTLFAKFDQKDAVTMEAKVQAIHNRYVNVEMVIFADTTDGQFGQNSLVARFYSTQFYLMCTQNGGTNQIMNRNTGNTISDATLRLAYDPATNKARAWLNSLDLGEYSVPNRLAQGKFVMFNARYPCRVTSLRVLQGVVGPSVSEKDDEATSHIVRFANKDRVAATEVGLADGKLTLKTAYGDITSPVDRASSIAFLSKGLEKPRRRKDDVRVETSDSRFTLQFERLTDEVLIGKSAALGDVKVRRDSLKKIQFNIYKQGDEQ